MLPLLCDVIAAPSFSLSAAVLLPVLLFLLLGAASLTAAILLAVRKKR